MSYRLPSRPVLVVRRGPGVGSFLSDLVDSVSGNSSSGSTDTSGSSTDSSTSSTDTPSTDTSIPVDQSSGTSTPIDTSGGSTDTSSPNFVSPPPGPTGLAAIPVWAWVAGAGLVAVVAYEVIRK